MRKSANQPGERGEGTFARRARLALLGQTVLARGAPRPPHWRGRAERTLRQGAGLARTKSRIVHQQAEIARLEAHRGGKRHVDLETAAWSPRAPLVRRAEQLLGHVEPDRLPARAAITGGQVPSAGDDRLHRRLNRPGIGGDRGEHAARRRSYELIAEAFELAGTAVTA